MHLLIRKSQRKDPRVAQADQEHAEWQIAQGATGQELIKAARTLHGRIDFNGLPCSIETGRSRVREWFNPQDGTQGMSRMTLPYGYILGTLGVDGDHFDIFIGPDRSAPNAYIVTTMAAPTFTEVDEQKGFVGVSAEEALRVFHASYSDPRFFGSMTEMPFEEFKAQVLSTRGNPRLLGGDEVAV